MTTSQSDLLGRYLEAIGLLLPRSDRADILKELRANLEAQVEDRVERLGRELTEADFAALLREHGHPAAVAARYQPVRYLVGPATWPYFVFGGKILAIAVAIGTFMHTLVTTLMQGHGWVWATFPARWPLTFFQVALPVFAVWVIITALVEKGRVALGADAAWDPQKMAKDGVGTVAEDWAESFARGAKAVANDVSSGHWRSDVAKDVSSAATSVELCSGFRGVEKYTFAKAFGEFFGAAVALVMWFLAFRFTHLFTGGVVTNLKGAPVWFEQYDYVMGILLVQLLVTGLLFLNVRSRALQHGVKALHAVFSLLIMQPFLQAPSLVEIQPLQDGMRDLTFLAEPINRWGFVALQVMMIITAIQVAVYVGKALVALFSRKENTPA